MNGNTKPKQTDRIIDYIKEFGSITQLEALRDLGIMRLASRVSELRKMGYPVIAKTEAVSNRYGEKCYIKRYMVRGCNDAKSEV